MKKATLLLLSVITLGSGRAQAKALDAEKPIVCGLSGARDTYLRHKKVLIVDNTLFLVRTNGEVYKDGEFECAGDNQQLECIGRTLNITVGLDNSLARVDERNATAMAGYFSSACENE